MVLLREADQTLRNRECLEKFTIYRRTHQESSFIIGPWERQISAKKNEVTSHLFLLKWTFKSMQERPPAYEA